MTPHVNSISHTCVVVEVRKLARMDQDEFSVIEDYLRMNQYPKGISKGDKANLRRKCKNFKFDCGVLYFRRVKKGEGDEEGWKICVRTEDEKKRILESCHAGIEGKTESTYYSVR